MSDTLDIHEPLLVNSIGHSVGLLLFACFLILVLRDRRKGQIQQDNLPAIAATFALLWNAGSLAVLAASSGLLPGSDIVAALSFAVLSLLPAALLHLSLEKKVKPVWIAGYAVSAIAVALHATELVNPDVRFHQAALWVITVGFGLLTIVASPLGRGLAGPRIPVSMCLFLFAISFVHFSDGHVRHAWSSEIAIHHAGIPLALYVLLQDYRFLLLDTFLRFLVNSVVASAFIGSCLLLDSRFRILAQARDNPFLQGILLVLACLGLAALVFVKGKLQLLLTRVVFRRPDREPAIHEIREAGARAENETALLETASEIMASFAGTMQREVRRLDRWEQPAEPVLVTAPGMLGPAPAWLEACVPLRFLKGDGANILLGRREGGRRYLSEDLQELGRLAAAAVEQVEHCRNSEIQRLVSQAELRALQSQINPHFLFNSFNTLYGTIPRDAPEARRMVLNLSEIFRYFLQADRTLIPLSEELKIVRAYLEIETLRLGDRLTTEINVDDAAAHTLIPILSVQPLVENAVKHGVAKRAAPGKVRVSARTGANGVSIAVSDDGRGFPPNDTPSGPDHAGVGLDNVRQRLRLCFGDSAALRIESSGRGSTVIMTVPANHAGIEPVRRNRPAEKLARSW